MQALPEKLFTAAQVREMDRIAIEEKGIAGGLLMRRAGAAVFEQIRLRWPKIRRLAIFCGGGNNAGDGYVVAGMALAAQYQVIVFAVVDPERLHGDALIMCREFIDAGGRIVPFQARYPLTGYIVVDALLGTGLDRNVGGDFAAAIEMINISACPVIAIDIPSGLNADTGRVMSTAVKAACTVSFIGLKQGLFTGEAAEYCGDRVFSRLQIPEDVTADILPSAKLAAKPSLPIRHRCAHKGRFGHVVLVGGDSGYTGAIKLAAEASLRCGAGLVSVATREAHCHLINCCRPEIMSHGVETAEQLNELLKKASVAVIGPGLGQSSWAKVMYSAVMTTGVDCVADADALNLLAKMPERLQNRILTPHPGEAARLLSCSTVDIEKDRFAAIKELQLRYGGVVLLKGAGSLVKGNGDLFVSITGNPGMASGGMGDVLSGMIAALLAQGMSLEKATLTAAYTHGEAADLVAAKEGERGMLASDLLPIIRQLLN